MITAILDPHRIVVGIDTLYTTQRETFTSEGQQLIDSALQTLHVMNLNNLEINHDEEGNYLAFEYNGDIPDRTIMSAYTRHTSSCMCCDCVRSPQSLTYVSSWGFTRLPPSCNSNYLEYIMKKLFAMANIF